MWTETLPSGKIKYSERYADPMTGRLRKVSVTMQRDNQKTRTEAERILHKRIQDALQDTSSKTTLSVLAQAYLLHQKLTVRTSTYHRNKIALRTILGLLGAHTIVDNMNVAYVQKKFLETGRAPGTLNEFLRRLKAMLRWGYQSELISKDLAGRLKRFHDVPHKAKIKDKYMESAELKTLLSHMQVDQWRLLTEFLALSGLRYGEAAALMDKDVDIEDQVIHITKNYDSVNEEVVPAKSITSIRDVYIQSELIPTCRKIRRLMQEKKMKYGVRSDLFLHDERGEHIHYYAYNKYLKENTKEILGRQLTVHSLRHTHASLMFEQGVDLGTISRRLGHEDSEITREIYLHVTKVLQKKDQEIIENIRVL